MDCLPPVCGPVWFPWQISAEPESALVRRALVRRCRVQPQRAAAPQSSSIRIYTLLIPLQFEFFSLFSDGGLQLLRGIQLAADALDLRHNPKSILAENLLYVTLGIAFFQQSVRNLWQLGCIFHPEGHVCAIKIGAKANVLNARNFYGVVDVLDDFGPLHYGQIAAQDVFPRYAVALDQLAAFSIPTSFLDFQRNRFVPFRMRFLRIPKFLAQKADVIINLNDAAFGGQRPYHVVGHITRRIANGPAIGM
jgi:hypothetical protein